MSPGREGSVRVWECRWSEGPRWPDLSWLLQLSQTATRKSQGFQQGVRVRGDVMADTTELGQGGGTRAVFETAEGQLTSFPYIP